MRNFMYFPVLLLLLHVPGCGGQPTPDSVVKLPPYTNYQAGFSWVAAEVPDLAPIPAPDNDVIKIGDPCPRCEGTGKIDGDHDGKVDADCRHCLGDGKVDEGDPIVPGGTAIKILVQKTNQGSAEVSSLKRELATLRSQVASLEASMRDAQAEMKRMDDACKCDEKEKIVGAVPKVSTVEAYTVTYQGKIYTWNPASFSFRSPEGLVIRPQRSTFNPLNESRIQICHGTYCEYIPILRSVVEVPNGYDTAPEHKDVRPAE